MPILGPYLKVNIVSVRQPPTLGGSERSVRALFIEEERVKTEWTLSGVHPQDSGPIDVYLEAMQHFGWSGHHKQWSLPPQYLEQVGDPSLSFGDLPLVHASMDLIIADEETR